VNSTERVRVVAADDADAIAIDATSTSTARNSPHHTVSRIPPQKIAHL
jgi:hypothetical protein